MGPIFVQYYDGGLNEGSILHFFKIGAYAEKYMRHVRIYSPIDDKTTLRMMLIYDSMDRDEELEQKAWNDWVDSQDDILEDLRGKGYSIVYTIHGGSMTSVKGEIGVAITIDDYPEVSV